MAGMNLGTGAQNLQSRLDEERKAAAEEQRRFAAMEKRNEFEALPTAKKNAIFAQDAAGVVSTARKDPVLNGKLNAVSAARSSGFNVGVGGDYSFAGPKSSVLVKSPKADTRTVIGVAPATTFSSNQQFAESESNGGRNGVILLGGDTADAYKRNGGAFGRLNTGTPQKGSVRSALSTPFAASAKRGAESAWTAKPEDFIRDANGNVKVDGKTGSPILTRQAQVRKETLERGQAARQNARAKLGEYTKLPEGKSDWTDHEGYSKNLSRLTEKAANAYGSMLNLQTVVQGKFAEGSRELDVYNNIKKVAQAAIAKGDGKTFNYAMKRFDDFKKYLESNGVSFDQEV